jgi:CheY-like chemotaxis protein
MDPSQVDQILINLCINARDAIADTGTIMIETGSIMIDETYCNNHPGFVSGDFVQLTVSDDGCGMNREVLANIFEPFFSTKGTSQNTGLGLATVYGIVKQNNGFINAYSEPGHGTRFTIYLPRHSDKAKPGRKKPEREEPDAHGDETILLVEDEPAIRKITRLMLEKLGYTVLIASAPDEAIRLVQSYADRIDLLITDVIMPGMNGRDLAEKLLALHPHLKCLFMSGYTANVIAHHGVLDKEIHFLQKPFFMKDLALKIREMLEGRQE